MPNQYHYVDGYEPDTWQPGPCRHNSAKVDRTKPSTEKVFRFWFCPACKATGSQRWGATSVHWYGTKQPRREATL